MNSEDKKKENLKKKLIDAVKKNSLLATDKSASTLVYSTDTA